MKTIKALICFVPIVILVSLAQAQEKKELPLKLEILIQSYESEKERVLKPTERKYESTLKTLQMEFTKAGRLDDALAVQNVIDSRILKEEGEGLLELMEGKWEWILTGSKVEFGKAGKTLDGHIALWVINPKERLLYFRTKDADWHYDIVLSEDGKSITAKRIQSGKMYSVKRVPN